MDDTLNSLRRAAALYEELAHARATTAAAPEREEHLSALAAEHAADAAAEVDQVAARRREARRLEGELRDLEARLQERRGLRSAMTDEHTIRALASELQQLQRKRDALEAEVIKAWDAIEAASAAAATVATSCANEQERISDRREEWAARQQRATAATAEIEVELETVLRYLPASTSARLARLAARLGNPVAGLLGGACDACGLRLPQQQAIDADQDRGVPTCAGCGRFVVARRGARRGEWT